MDRSGGYSEEENVQLKIYSDQDTHGMAAWVIIFALVFCGLMYYDSGETRWELIERVVLGGVPIISLTITLAMYVALCRELVMSKEGCRVSFWKIHQFYKWNELSVKRYENYKDMMYSTPVSYTHLMSYFINILHWRDWSTFYIYLDSGKINDGKNSYEGGINESIFRGKIAQWGVTFDDVNMKKVKPWEEIL